jgi:hypothetical protein
MRITALHCLRQTPAPRARCGPQRRRRPTDCDLRGAGGRCDQRQARVTQRATRGMRPALQGRPPGHGLGGDRPGTDPPTDRDDRLPDDRPQRERHRDRRMPVVPPRRDPAWHYREDRPAVHATISSALDHDPPGRAVCVGRTAELAIAQAVAVQPKPAPGRTAGGAAVDARSRPGGLH